MKYKLFLLVLVVSIAACTQLCSHNAQDDYVFNHPTKWYEYSFDRGPSVGGYIYEFTSDQLVVHMLYISLIEGTIVESNEYKMDITSRTNDGYELHGEDGVRASIHFEKDNLELIWHKTGISKPNRVLTSIAPNIDALRAQWEEWSGTPVSDFSN